MISGKEGNKAFNGLHKQGTVRSGIAAQTLCLKAHELGLGTVVVGLMNHEACEKILAVPEGHKVYAVNPIGRPATEPKAGPPRKPLSEIVFLNNLDKPMF
ncbi:MAG: nitroreductase family protein [Syntrophaceae bacterium]|nr:nitroreductase family protein [Syntrophaceae bacterium]